MSRRDVMQQIRRQLPVVLAALLCPSLLFSQTERLITAEELGKFKPETVARVQPGASTVRLSRDAVRRIAQPAIDRNAATSSGSRTEPETATASPDIRLAPGQYVMLRSSEPARKFSCGSATPGECTETPVRYLTMTPGGDPLNLSLVLASTQNFRFDQRGNRFIGNLFVQLRDLDAPTEVREIGSTIRVAVNADVDEISPGAILDIDQTNRFRNVTLAAISPRDPTVVELTPERSADAQELVLGVSRPHLQVQLGKSRILGFGLETTTVTVRIPGIETALQEAVTVSSETGHLDRNVLGIDKQTHVASTRLRSRGTGTDVITAELGRFAAGTDSIDYELPWTWLIAVLLGIAVGIGIRLTMRDSRHPKTGVVFNIAIGALGGLLTAVLYALGVNVLSLPLPGGFSEGLTFVLSALGGWGFPRWLAALGPRPAGNSG